MILQNLHVELSKLSVPHDACAILQSYVAEIGATSAIFSSYVMGDPTADSYRFVLAADVALCDIYLKRFWFLNDPCICYANSHTEPVRISQILTSTAAQREILYEASNHGFKSGFVVPVHGSSASSRVGVLFVGSDDPNKFDSKESFDAHRVVSRVVAMEFYDFIVTCVRRELLESADLTSDDLTLLRMQRDGFQSKDMAKLLGSTPAAIDKRFTRLNQRLGVATRRQAADLATHYDILN